MTVVKFSGPRVLYRYCPGCGWEVAAALVERTKCPGLLCPSCQQFQLSEFAPIMERDHETNV